MGLIAQRADREARQLVSDGEDATKRHAEDADRANANQIDEARRKVEALTEDERRRTAQGDGLEGSAAALREQARQIEVGADEFRDEASKARRAGNYKTANALDSLASSASERAVFVKS